MLYTITTVNPQLQYLGQERKNICRHYLFGDKIIQNSLKTDATHYYDNNLLLWQETHKKIACHGRWYNNNNNKNIDSMS